MSYALCISLRFCEQQLQNDTMKHSVSQRYMTIKVMLMTIYVVIIKISLKMFAQKTVLVHSLNFL